MTDLQSPPSVAELRYWERAEYREKYSDDDREKMAKSGETMPDGSYPIKDAEDMDNAIHAVGRGGADHDDIRKYIIGRAKDLDMSDKIPDNWNADGSLKAESKSGRRKQRHRAVPLTREVRFFSPTRVEVRKRADESDPTIKLRGSAIMYGVPYRVVDFFGEFRETMHAGCATALIARGVDCRLLLNHEGLPMARTLAGTMRLIDTPTSLDFEAELDARQQLANDFAIAIERGDLSQMSIGMVVGNDEWGEDDDMETRDVFALEDLIDVSGVTFPCSETTHIEVAQRMINSVPLQSRARLRSLELELRAGAVQSKASQEKIITALKALHDLADAGGVDVSSLDPTDNEAEGESTTLQDGTDGDTGLTAEDAAELAYPDGSGARMAPRTRQERRAVSGSYNDRKSAVWDALMKLLPASDPDWGPDFWICDMGDDWVVYECFEGTGGMFNVGYTIGPDGSASIVGDPVAVSQETTYVSKSEQPKPMASEPESRSQVTESLRLMAEARSTKRHKR